MTRSNGARIASWTISAFLMLTFVVSGTTKLAGVELHRQNFARWGYPGWFLPLTGAIELLAALLVIIPRTRFVGAALIVCVMLGALATHVRFAEYAMFPLPVVLFLLALADAVLNRPAISRK